MLLEQLAGVAKVGMVGAFAWVAAVGSLCVDAQPVLAHAPAATSLADLEAHAAADKSSASVAALASAYLQQEQPGLATAVIERAPSEVRHAPEVAHLYARSLFQRGRAREALAVERAASEACDEGTGCSAWMIAKTTRQLAFFEQVVAAGIEDPAIDPAGVGAAYARSSHAVGLIAMR